MRISRENVQSQMLKSLIEQGIIDETPEDVDSVMDQFYDEGDVHDEISVRVEDYGFHYEYGSESGYHDDSDIVAEGAGVVRFVFNDLEPFDVENDLTSGQCDYTYSEDEARLEVELQLNINKGSRQKIVSFNGEPLTVFETWVEISWYVKD